MNGTAFLTLIAEALKTDIHIGSCAGIVCVKINGQSWTGITLDEAIANIKQSFAIKYLENFKS